MKYHIIAALFIFIGAPYALFSMDQNPSSFPFLFSQPLNLKALNKVSDTVAFLIEPLTTHYSLGLEKFETIFNKRLEEKYPVHTQDDWNKVFNTLFDRNHNFKSYAHHCMRLVENNCAKVTCRTLSTVLSSTAWQPEERLDRLILPLREWIIQRVKDRIVWNYKIHIKEENAIVACCICNYVDKIAISTKDRCVTIWSLLNGKKEVSIINRITGPISLMAFSANGDYLAMGQTGTRFVDVWDMNTLQCIYTIQNMYALTDLKYTDSLNYPLLLIFSTDNKYQLNIDMWNGSIHYGGQTLQYEPQPYPKITDGKYTLCPPALNVKNISIEKQSNWAHYLCYKAVENTCNQMEFTAEDAIAKENDCMSVKTQEPFQFLTPYEKELILAFIQTNVPAKTPPIKRARNR